MSGPTFVDLFSGCGGFGLGAVLSGFKNIASVDIDPNLQSSYKLNFPSSNVFLADVSQLDANFWSNAIGDTPPDLVIGGPPCQGFSRIGLRKPQDPRNSLITHFFRQILLLKPKCFVMENVEGILDVQNKIILEEGLALISNQYSITGPFKINALDCGAATSRRRVIVIGYNNNYSYSGLDNKIFVPTNKPVTVAEAIGDLPSPGETASSMENGYEWWEYKAGAEISSYAKRLMRTKSGIGAGFSVSKLKQGMVSGLMKTVHTENVRTRFSQAVPGTVEKISRYPRLSWDGHCPTLRAGTGSDKGSFQAMRPIHPDEARVITVREAARLQGFPDWFIFHPTIWHSFRMIGNSVSPIMARHLLEIVMKSIV